MLKDFKARLYQETILSTAVSNNTLVVLPTGMGKTLIATLLIANRLTNYPNSKVLILAPTRPLAEQHIQTLNKYTTLNKEQIVLFTGFVKPKKRAELWTSAKIIVSTPQGLENDILGRNIFLEDVSLLVVDEAHRAVKDYAYVFVAKQYYKKAKYPRILGLTASPGSNKETIAEVCKNLFIESIEVRTDTDPDMKPYIQEVDITWISVNFPESFKEIKYFLETCFKTKLSEMKNLGHLNGNVNNYTRVALIQLQRQLQGFIAQGEKDYNILKSISLLAEAMKVQHALELLETQGLNSLLKYFQKLKEQAKTSNVKAVKNLVQDINFRSAEIKLNNLLDRGEEHPKLSTLKNLIQTEIQRNKNLKIILFVQYRNSIIKIKKILDELKIKSKIFIGQAKKEGLGISQKEQKQILDEFKNNEFNCLISTSVGEEGLDIPQVNLVVFYEPTPSAIRHIQRRGRTGRQEKGRVIILVTKNTRDEGYRWSAHHKEKRMYTILKSLKENFSTNNFALEIENKSNKSLNDFEDKERLNQKNEENEETTFFVDHREKGSKVIKELNEFGCIIKFTTLDIGDYLLSEDIVIEYKTKKDFVDSIIDGRLLSQLKELIKYKKPLLIIEGESDIYSQRNIHPNAIRGMLSTIAISYRIPIIQTNNYKESAALMYIIAKREQDQNKKEFQTHTSKPLSLKEQQEYIISAIPGVGSVLAKPLLQKFKSVKKVINASEEQLKKIAFIGNKKASKIKEVVESEYQDKLS
ncbi:MAG: DEAD/DEAH box helicase [Nanoarchaeota archaeon]|nr:DEAD/DEAH box helicase [Nanoarchaeota archaeon]MBU1030503.1 DEAD/DEAH box helicase [Nanoarchaeota archaeon]MBU1850485.1 DEAD/DEAH box helicase [Nanoarchaeota archaeon]